MKLPGLPLPLASYPAELTPNPRFAGFDLARWSRIVLPLTLAPLVDAPPLEIREFVEDDNRTAILPEPVATLDGQPFYLSVKGVGSTIDPYAHRPLDPTRAAELSDDPEVRERLLKAPAQAAGGIITGELWLRGSPYGGQGREHAETALAISARADLTSIEGFRLAPVIGVAAFPPPLEERLRSIHWYRKYRGRIVQEVRLVPSNVRIYFHARTTVGNSVGAVFDRFSVDTPARARTFETNFVRSAFALMTLFARTLRFDPGRGRYSGLEFHDVWLDKDAVLAPDGSAYFVDLEGIEEVPVDRDQVTGTIEDQVYRSLYEFMFAYEQIESERARRFGADGSRKRHFEAVVEQALRDDPYVRLVRDGRELAMRIGNRCAEESLSVPFPLVDP